MGVRLAHVSPHMAIFQLSEPNGSRSQMLLQHIQATPFSKSTANKTPTLLDHVANWTCRLDWRVILLENDIRQDCKVKFIPGLPQCTQDGQSSLWTQFRMALRFHKMCRISLRTWISSLTWSGKYILSIVRALSTLFNCFAQFERMGCQTR